MMLPNADQVEVPRRKIVEYLLATSHPEGRGKAIFFRRYGYGVGRWEELARALTRHAAVHPVTSVEASPFGTRYVVEGTIEAPDGRQPSLRSVWFVAEGGGAPRFVTAYPIKGEL